MIKSSVNSGGDGKDISPQEVGDVNLKHAILMVINFYHTYEKVINLYSSHEKESLPAHM